MRSLVALSICVVISGLAACGGLPEGGDEPTSSVSPTLELSRPPIPCRVPGTCGIHALPGAYVSDSAGPFAALVLSDTRCRVGASSLKSYCFFGELAQGIRIEGEYAALGGEIALLYRVRDTSLVLSRYRYERVGSSLQLRSPDSDEVVESMTTVESWCQRVADCRDQPLVEPTCPGATFPKTSCEDAACVTVCDVIPLPPPDPIAQPASGPR